MVTYSGQGCLLNSTLTDLRLQSDQLRDETGTVAEAIEKLIVTNAQVVQNHTDYQQRFNKRWTANTDELQEHCILLAEITDLQNPLDAYHHCNLFGAEQRHSEFVFTPCLWTTRVDHAEVDTLR